METSNHSTRSYKFNFWKDRFWIWALCLPFGLIMWAIPFVLLVGLANADNAPGWFPLFGFLLLGIPGYLLGWIFVYSLMEGLYTKVTITEERVSIRLPWLIFPLIPVVKRIDLDRVHRINLYAAYGSRTAVFLYYYQKTKERHFYLPRFQHDPAYIQEMLALKERIDPTPIQSISSPTSLSQGTLPTGQAPAGVKRLQGPRSRRIVDRVLNDLIVYSFLALLGISGWITLALPASNKVEAFIAGPSLAFMCFLLAVLLCNFLPVLGAVAFWFLGHPLLRAMLWLFQVPDMNWKLPPAVEQVLGRWNIPPVHSTLLEFFFWATLVISIEVSISSIVGRIGRRASKRSIPTREEKAP